MKKTFTKIFAAGVFAFSLLAVSCASIPEPTEKNPYMVYGNVKVSFNWKRNNYGIPENCEIESGITVKVKNLKTEKVYFLHSNSNGEIISTKLPKGKYQLCSIKAPIKVKENDWNFEDNFYADYSGPVFYLVEEGVLNLGKISYDIKDASDNVHKWRYNYSISYGWDCDLTKHKFELLHPDSDWLDEDWTNITQ